MIIYEVNLEVEKPVEERFLLWLKDHIQEVRLTGDFLAANFFKIENSEGKGLFSVQYSVEKREKLDLYLKNHASTFRQEGLDLFGEKFKATRRILQLI